MPRCFLLPNWVGSILADISWIKISHIAFSCILLNVKSDEIGRSISNVRTGYSLGIGVIISFL